LSLAPEPVKAWLLPVAVEFRPLVSTSAAPNAAAPANAAAIADIADAGFMFSFRITLIGDCPMRAAIDRRLIKSNWSLHSRR
jgi:hypothetical protein